MMQPEEKETCWTLIRGAADGAIHDREEFARRYLPTVHGYLSARWRGSYLLDEVDDIVQEVFLACFREGGALARLDSKNQSGFRALLYSVTRNVALHAERTRARRVKRVREGQLDAEILEADDPTLSRIFDRGYAMAVMRHAREIMMDRAADRGPDSEQRVELLRLRFEENLPVREIAGRWGVDATSVHRDYAKASREFRSALAEAVSQSELCSPHQLEAECDRLLGLLR